MGLIVQLRNDEASWFELNRVISSYYAKQERHMVAFRAGKISSSESLEFCFLIDRKHVIKYVISHDRGCFLGGIFLGVGPEYFGPADFWSYKNSERFTLDTDAHAVVKNLRLLDEFLGYPVQPLHIP